MSGTQTAIRANTFQLVRLHSDVTVCGESEPWKNLGWEIHIPPLDSRLQSGGSSLSVVIYTGQELRHVSPNGQKGSMHNEEGKGLLKAPTVLPKLYMLPLLQLGSFNHARCVQAVTPDTFLCLGHSIVSVFLGFKNKPVWGMEMEPA